MGRRGLEALALGALALGLAACGGDRPRTVEVTEAPPESEVTREARRPSALDTTYADSGLFVDPRLRPDSLRADSLRRDSLLQDSLARVEARRPDFRAFWPTFREAIEEGLEAASARAAFSDSLARADFEDTWFPALAEPPFRAGVLALTARDFRREGTRRTASVTVGYDAEGRVVREDEAVTESSLILTFDVVDGAYRLVRAQIAG